MGWGYAKGQGLTAFHFPLQPGWYQVSVVVPERGLAGIGVQPGEGRRRRTRNQTKHFLSTEGDIRIMSSVMSANTCWDECTLRFCQRRSTDPRRLCGESSTEAACLSRDPWTAAVSGANHEAFRCGCRLQQSLDPLQGLWHNFFIHWWGKKFCEALSPT